MAQCNFLVVAAAPARVEHHPTRATTLVMPSSCWCSTLAGAAATTKSCTEPLFAKQRTSENLYLLSKFRLRKRHRNQRKVVCILRVWVVCPGIPSVLQEQYAASSSRAPTPSKIHSAASRSGYKPVVEVLFLRSE